MEFRLIATALLILLATIVVIKQIQRKRNKTKPPHPPGPKGWPIIGNMLDLAGTDLPHRAFYDLRAKYGPVVWLRLGSMNTMVVQSARAATELFKNHDSSFCDGKVLQVFTANEFHKATLAIAPYGPSWRMLRKLYVTDLISNKNVNATSSLRERCVSKLLRNIEEETEAVKARGDSGEVNVAHFLFLMSFNVMSNITVSRDLLDPNCKGGQELFRLMERLMVLAGTPNVADFFPLLKWLDLQGVKRNMARVQLNTMNILAEYLKERIKEQGSENVKSDKDFLDVLLGYEYDDENGVRKKITNDDILKIIMEVFFAGAETSSTTIEWAMAELLHNPDKLRKAKEELDQVFGQQPVIEEKDLSQLPYLQAVVKETFRLHPGIPLLVPRNTLQDTNFMGYFVPKDTQVLVNAWTIGRDPEAWEDPFIFKPERFLGSNIDYKGQNFELIPFGSGRRICVGMPVAQRVVQLGLASLLHYFDWEVAGGSESIDMGERMGITVRKIDPLMAIPKKRFVA